MEGGRREILRVDGVTSVSALTVDRGDRSRGGAPSAEEEYGGSIDGIGDIQDFSRHRGPNSRVAAEEA